MECLVFSVECLVKKLHGVQIQRFANKQSIEL